MPTVSVEDLERAVAQLSGSEKGRRVMHDLLAFLDNGGVSLDDDNQRHVLCLLSGVWGSYAGTTLEILRDAVEPRDELANAEATA